MIRSMTGFGRAERTWRSLRVGVEIRSVNNRHAEVRVKVPSSLASIEEGLRRKLGAAVRRGRAEASVTVSGLDMSAPVEVNHALIRGYMVAAGEVARKHRLTGSVTLESVLALPGAVTLRSAGTELPAGGRKAVEAAFDAAVSQFEKTRAREGRHLAGDLGRRLRSLERHRSALQRRAAGSAGRWAERLKARLAEIGRGLDVDPARLAQEVAFLASRSDITEELVRLQSHVAQARKLLDEDGEPAGRKLDFLLQEMHREANTINSKSEDIQVSRHALAIKAEIEKIREQAQNIE